MKFYEMYDLFEFVLHLYEHLCFIYGKIIFQFSFRNGKSTTVLPYKNRIKPKSLVQMKFHLNARTFKKGNTWGMGRTVLYVIASYGVLSTSTGNAVTPYESHAPHISFFDSASILMKFSFVLEISV